MKDIKENINRRRDSPCSWVGGIDIVKMLSEDSMQSLPNHQWQFSTELEPKNLTIHMET